MKCSITNLPIPFCAHCQNGLPKQMEDDGRGFRRSSITRAPIATQSLITTIDNALRPVRYSGIGRYRIESSTPTTRWGMEQQLKTFYAICGVKEGLYEHPRGDERPNPESDSPLAQARKKARDAEEDR